MDVKFDAHAACESLVKLLHKSNAVEKPKCLIISQSVEDAEKNLYFFSGTGEFQLNAFCNLAIHTLDSIDKEKKFRLLNAGLLHKLVDKAVEDAYGK